MEKGDAGGEAPVDGAIDSAPGGHEHADDAGQRPAKDVVHSDTVTTEYTTNWSGVGNSNTLTKWNPKTSFDSVYSQFNVPVVQQAFDVCDGGYDWEVTWNGIDGFKNGTVLQGGSSL